jgi:hypothetical protein
MRKAVTPLVVGLLSATATCLCAAQTPAAAPAAAQAPAESPPRMPQMLVPPTVYLNGVADLEHLRETNFHHYLRAKKILAAANEICRPKPGKQGTYPARFKGADPQCGSMWMTSLPPKKQLRFHLDGIYYVALVTVTGNARPIQIGDEKRRAPPH